MRKPQRKRENNCYIEQVEGKYRERYWTNKIRIQWGQLEKMSKDTNVALKHCRTLTTYTP